MLVRSMLRRKVPSYTDSIGKDTHGDVVSPGGAVLPVTLVSRHSWLLGLIGSAPQRRHSLPSGLQTPKVPPDSMYQPLPHSTTPLCDLMDLLQVNFLALQRVQGSI